MSLRVYTGLPASGKTKAIITDMRSRTDSGGDVVLILSSEHEALTKRPNVRPGGMMGCRDSAYSFPIDHVVNTAEAQQILADAAAGTLVTFDEAQFFQPGIVEHWKSASERGVDIIVGTPSQSQLQALVGATFDHIPVSVNCQCRNSEATRAVYSTDLVYPTHLCETCFKAHMQSEISKLLEDVHSAEPFPGEFHTYQPFYEVDMKDWQLVRNDCPARLAIILEAANRCSTIKETLNDDVLQPSFIDLGCCSGFFADGMSSAGYISSGVDVSEDFIKWASRLAHIKGQPITYRQQDLTSFLTGTDQHYDVISTFATVQWVMAQEGYEAGLKCFEEIFSRANALCVIEMGYTSEDIYRDKITDRPKEIDKDWMMELMTSSGHFHSVELHPAGENGIWRDIFVGFKKAPDAPRVFDDFLETGATQTSKAAGYWNDNWTGPNLVVHFQAKAPVKGLSIEGWRPDGSTSSDISVAVNGTRVASEQVGEGLFNLAATLSVDEGEFFELCISSSESFVPEGDARELAFVLRNLSFN